MDRSLRGHPVAVGGDPENRHGIILAKNYEAKKFGIQTGEALWQARNKCHNLIIVPPHYEQYMKYSRLAHEIYLDYTNQVEPYGMDECWLDVSGSIRGTGEQIGNEIRQRMKDELGLTISVGVSFNKVFAKLGSDMKKPDALLSCHSLLSHDSLHCDCRGGFWEQRGSQIRNRSGRMCSHLFRPDKGQPV